MTLGIVRRLLEAAKIRGVAMRRAGAGAWYEDRRNAVTGTIVVREVDMLRSTLAETMRAHRSRQGLCVQCGRAWSVEGQELCQAHAGHPDDVDLFDVM